MRREAVPELQAENEKLWQLIQRLLRHRYGPRSERLDLEQLQLVLEDAEQSATEDDAAKGAAESVRQMRSRPLVEALQLWLQDRLPRVPGWSDLAKAMRYILRHWEGLILYLDDGRLEMDTNVAPSDRLPLRERTHYSPAATP